MCNDNNITITTYSATPKAVGFRTSLMVLWKSLMESRELGWRLFIRDISAQYRQTILGMLWIFIPPIATGLIFVTLRSNGILTGSETNIPYPVYVFTGALLWQIFTLSLSMPLKVVMNAKPILVKIKFPYEALIISGLFQVLLSCIINCVVIIIFLMAFDLRITLTQLIHFPLIVSIVLLGLGLGFLITPIGMLYADIQSALPIISQLWFFLTPIVYTPPVKFPISMIMSVNPVSPLLVGLRDYITTGKSDLQEQFIIVAGIALVIFLASWLFFRFAMSIIVERIGS